MYIGMNFVISYTFPNFRGASVVGLHRHEICMRVEQRYPGTIIVRRITICSSASSYAQTFVLEIHFKIGIAAADQYVMLVVQVNT